MKNIPVEFDLNGKHYKGELTPVHGAGGKMYYLMINNYYRGQLFYAEYSDIPHLPKVSGQEKYKWRFVTQKAEYPELAEYFAKCIETSL